MTYIESDPRWSAPDSTASEYEVQDFLYGLVRLLKPERVLETGCYRGDSSLAIARALKANMWGKLVTCDTDPAMVNITRNRLLSFQEYTSCFEASGEKICESYHDVNLVFLDSGGDRVSEAKRLLLADGGLVVLHDTSREQVFEGVRKLFPKVLKFPTPRGIAIFQK